MVGDRTMLKLSQDKTETKGNESKRLVVFYLRGINNDIHYFMILYSWFSSTGTGIQRFIASNNNNNNNNSKHAWFGMLDVLPHFLKILFYYTRH